MIPKEELIIHQKVIEAFDGDIEQFVRHRKSCGLSQKDVATALGFYDASVISHFEAGDFGLDSRGHTLFLLITGKHPRYQLQEKIGFEGFELLTPAPSGRDIRRTRINANGMNQMKMAKLLELNGKTIISKYENGKKTPSIANWTVFLLLSSQHPYYEIRPI